jgi:hypothetical protein
MTWDPDELVKTVTLGFLLVSMGLLFFCLRDPE